MKKLIAIALMTVVGFSLAVGFVAAVRSASKPSFYTRRDRPRLQRIAELKKNHPDGQPQAVAAHTAFDFGVLNPSETFQHTFLIRNTGLAPLELKRGPTTCKCTLSDLAQNTVFPGQETEVSLEWNTGRSEAEFRQSAKIFTNDPQRPEIDFQIHGKVRRRFFAEPQAVVFPPVLPGESATASALVCSGEWEAFELSKVVSSLEGLTWQVEPADSEALRELEARSGYRVVFTSPRNLADRWINGIVTLTATGLDESQSPETIELSLAGKVRNRLAVFGSQIDENGLVDFGILAAGQGAQAQLVMRVRDEEPGIKIRAVKVTPDVLKATVTPLVDADGVAKPALYRIHIEVPKNTPECHHMGVHQGQVVLEVDHPRISGITIKVGFVVKSNLPE